MIVDQPLEDPPAACHRSNPTPSPAPATTAEAATGAVTDEVRWANQPGLSKLSSLGIYAHVAVLFGPANQVVLAAIAIGLLVMIFR